MAIDYSTWITSLAGVTVTGVARYYTAPPAQLSTADLPCMYPRLPSTETPIATMTSVSGLDTVAVELVIVVEPTMQNRTATNFSTTLDLMDALNAALKTNAATLYLDSWSIRGETGAIGESNYWLIIATVNASY